MTTKEMIEVMQAFSEGKTIQYKSPDAFKWIDMGFSIWNFEQYVYRIKPKEPTYRPYDTTEEMVEDFKMRINKNQPAHSMPLIWIRGKGVMTRRLMVVGYHNFSVYLSPYIDEIGLNELFELYTYLDGSPVGKLVE